MQDKLFKILFFMSFMVSCVIVNADGIYTWKDARGNTQYGDQPPKKSKAHAVKMPQLTIIKDYGKQWQPLHFKTKPASINNVNKPKKYTPIVAEESAASFTPSYQTLNFIAPKQNQIIHAKDGDVSAMLSLKPPLKNGHSIIFYIDGKRINTGTSRITNFKALSEGSHSLLASIIDQKGNLAMKAETINFHVKK